MDDEDEIQKAKEKFAEELILKENLKKTKATVIDWRKYYLAGILSSFVVGLWLTYQILGALCIGCFEVPPLGPIHFLLSLFFLPIGILSGFIGSQLGKKYSKTGNQGWFVLLSILMVPLIVACIFAVLFFSN